jgi:tellurite methyltransferase
MSVAAAEKWDEIYTARLTHAHLALEDLTPNPFLVLAQSYLPKQGRALDLASGLGGDSLFLAQQGLEVDAWDASSVAMAWLESERRRLGLVIRTRRIDIDPSAFDDQTFDVIHVHHFLDRSLCHSIAAALKPNGILVFSTFLTPFGLSETERAALPGPSRSDFRLAPGELVDLFPTLNPVLHLETPEGERTPQALPKFHSLLVGQRSPSQVGVA